jgi:hypothetical protein
MAYQFKPYQTNPYETKPHQTKPHQTMPHHRRAAATVEIALLVGIMLVIVLPAMPPVARGIKKVICQVVVGGIGSTNHPSIDPMDPAAFNQYWEEDRGWCRSSATPDRTGRYRFYFQ